MAMLWSQQAEGHWNCTADLRGRDGRDGKESSPGRDGRDGRDGEKGESGPKGEQGAKGRKGDRGPILLHAMHAEYTGYMATQLQHPSAQKQDTICLDKDAIPISGSGASTDPSVVYTMHISCNGLPCPPYVERRALTCAICSK